MSDLNDKVCPTCNALYGPTHPAFKSTPISDLEREELNAWRALANLQSDYRESERGLRDRAWHLSGSNLGRSTAATDAGEGKQNA